MRILFDGPEPLLETQGQGDIVRGQARDMDARYAYDLIVSGRVKPADDDAQDEYRRMRAEAINQAVETGGDIYCDGCQQQMRASVFVESGCPNCGEGE